MKATACSSDATRYTACDDKKTNVQPVLATIQNRKRTVQAYTNIDYERESATIHYTVNQNRLHANTCKNINLEPGRPRIGHNPVDDKPESIRM